NIPLEFLLEGSDIELLTLYIVPGLPLPQPLPEHDVALVAIGEDDAAHAALAEVAALLPDWPHPVLNLPGHIARLGRERLFEALAGAPAVAIPPTGRIGRAALRRLNRAGAVDFPVVVRPVGSHAGRGLARLDATAAVAPYLAERHEAEFYLSPFVDYRS